MTEERKEPEQREADADSSPTRPLSGDSSPTRPLSGDSSPTRPLSGDSGPTRPMSPDQMREFEESIVQGEGERPEDKATPVRPPITPW